MSFRWFIYYCTLFGGCAAYLGWVLGRLSALESSLGQATVRGVCLGVALGLGLTLVDLLGNGAGEGLEGGVARPVGASIGALGGFVGGALGQLLYGRTQQSLFLVLGWAVTGLLIGTAPGAYELLGSMMRDEDMRGAGRKVVNGLLGGALGGLLGGVVYLVLRAAWGLALRDALAAGADFWSASATGFVALGLCIGLLVGLAQVVLKEAWLRVEVGFRAGRELILSKVETTIGKGEACDVGLFGGPGVEKLHARILLEGGRYLLADAGTPGGTFLNGERITRPTPLRDGDEVRLGRSVLRFGERQKRPQGA